MALVLDQPLGTVKVPVGEINSRILQEIAAHERGDEAGAIGQKIGCILG